MTTIPCSSLPKVALITISYCTPPHPRYVFFLSLGICFRLCSSGLPARHLSPANVYPAARIIPWLLVLLPLVGEYIPEMLFVLFCYFPQGPTSPTPLSPPSPFPLPFPSPSPYMYLEAFLLLFGWQRLVGSIPIRLDRADISPHTFSSCVMTFFPSSSPGGGGGWGKLLLSPSCEVHGARLTPLAPNISARPLTTGRFSLC